MEVQLTEGGRTSEMVQDPDRVWIAYPSGYDYAQWGVLELAKSELFSHLEKSVDSQWENDDYRYWVNHNEWTVNGPGGKTRKKHSYSVGRRPKSERAMLEHVRLIHLQGRFVPPPERPSAPISDWIKRPAFGQGQEQTKEQAEPKADENLDELAQEMWQGMADLLEKIKKAKSAKG